MSRINTNVTALLGARVLNANNRSLASSLEKLSTGLRINRGADDPAGLIASENLRKEIRGTETGIKNAQRAINIVSTAEGALNEVSALLLDLQGLLVEVANEGGITAEEVDANQLQVDSILNSVNRIANTTEFGGIKLLNGNLAYTTSSVSSTYIGELKVNAAKLIDNATMTVNIKQLSAADTGHVRLSGLGTSGNQPLTLEIGSGRGTTELTFAGSTKISAMVFAINQVREVTGVSAALSGATVAANLYSIDFGSDAYVSVETLSGSQTDIIVNKAIAGANDTTAKDYGVNAIATVNGTSAVANGKKLTIRTAMLEIEADLNGTAALSAADWSTTFGILGTGGTDFALGSSVTAQALESIGIENIATTKLGNADDGYLNTLKSGGTNALDGDNLYTAQKIVQDAIKDISTLRGRLGSFQKNTLETTINSLGVARENLLAAESAIRDTDFASETANLTRSQILVNAATSVLAQATFAPQSVLSLLG